jgi:NADH dehydrogenase [ubiquinone] 1 alpha subcomplex assembly factor 8
MPTIAGRQRPIEKLAAAVAKCSVEATAYGQCVLKDYQSTHQDMCVKEFMRLKECYLVSLGFF